MKKHIETLVLADLEKQPVNARFMKSETFRTLVANITRDNGLTSVPLVRTLPDGGYRILSGHHRVAAAIEAGITEAECMVLDEEISRQQEVALVLSHNSLEGQDDPDTLRALYEELDDSDWRWYSGLDDRTLELLDKVDTEGLSEANLEFATINLVFLPHEKDRAAASLDEAKKRGNLDELWLAHMAQYNKVLDALDVAQRAHNVTNTATGLEIVLQVFENHLADLQEGWVGEQLDGMPRAKAQPASRRVVPMETAFGSRVVHATKAAKIVKAFRQAEKAGDMPEKSDPWDFIAYLADTYLMSAQPDNESDDAA